MTFEDRLAAISGCYLFRGLDSLGQQRLASRATSRSYEPNGIIFQKGEPAEYLVMITRGAIRLSLSSAAGREFVLDVAGEGDLLGALSFIDGGRWEADCIAFERTHVLRIERAMFPDVLKTDFDGRLGAVLCRRLRSTITLIESLTLHALDERLARLLSHLDQRARTTSSVSLDRLHQGLIAMMANASRPKVNQQLQRLRKKGVIELDAGNISIVRPNCLEDIIADFD